MNSIPEAKFEISNFTDMRVINLWPGDERCK